MKLYPFEMTKRFMIVSLALLIGVALLIAACSSRGNDPIVNQPTGVSVPPTNTAVPQPAVEEQAPQPQPQDLGPMDVVGTAASQGNLTQFVSLLQSAGIEEKLRAGGPFTMFVPTDDAFAAFSSDILNNPELLFDVLLYHIIDGKLTSGDLANQIFMTTLLGDDVAVTIDGADIRLDDSVIITRDLDATNGIIHVIDTVLIPPSSGLIRTPNGTAVVRSTLPDLLTVAQTQGRFDILLDGLAAAGLTSELADSGPFTLFAPTDDAFLQLAYTLSRDKVDRIDKEPASLLRHHIIAGDLRSPRLTHGSSWPTLNGTTIVIAATADGLSLMDERGPVASLTSTDLPARNGIIHIIDTVVFTGDEAVTK